MSLRDLVNVSGGSGGDTPVFTAPWQAEIFAMVLALHDRGLFTWPEWADALSLELKKTDARDDASDYYQRWLKALESLITTKNITLKADIDQLTLAWQRAALATPHGQPIRLENDPDRV